ncbi:MAG TPA: Rieske 2Fe-2S domain-containing protein [Candidatus Dormibacteraeota bacterium]|jgi:UDP-MurNAc hydroxylase|nr:Rieske 2Fe-2S domain-containing protein [Candidatus Dormibacteraeota bacterium]
MQITYLGHAGFVVETDSATIVADPWLSPEGAFDSGWFQLPCNHGLAPLVREKLRDRSKKRFVYVSHEHRDHFDASFLKTLPVDELTFIVPYFQRDALRSEIGEMKPGEMILCKHGEAVAIPGGSAKLYLDDSGINRDSSILVTADGQTFLNLNDCKLNDELPAICKSEGPISILTCQFSGATWHPTCYEYEQEEYERIAKKKLTGKLEMVARAIETVQPRIYLPSAGPACFLDPTLIHLNFQPVNIFPRAPQLFEYLHMRLPGSETGLLEIMPGDVVNAETGQFEPLGTERVSDSNFERYIRSYAARYESFFAERQVQPTEERGAEILGGLKLSLEHKLSAFELHNRLRVPLYFGFSDMPHKMLRIDFPSRKVEPVSEIAETDFYSLFTPSWQIARVLEKAITWEEFALTFRVRLNRKPDMYQTLIQGFLLLESDDMNWFCRKLLEIEQSQSRAVIDAGGICYSIDRFCPHQGADLTKGWADEGRLWTCPRHRWQFALDKDGQCLTGAGSIHAICLEPE